eukprot:350905-Chlamydomonas_euryale.AAC.5
MKKAEQGAPSRMAGVLPSCNNISAADWQAVLNPMDRDAMDAGEEAVDLASDDEDVAGADEAEAMAADKAFQILPKGISCAC